MSVHTVSPSLWQNKPMKELQCDNPYCRTAIWFELRAGDENKLILPDGWTFVVSRGRANYCNSNLCPSCSSSYKSSLGFRPQAVFLFRDYDGHRTEHKEDPPCSKCWYPNDPVRCECGGWVHSEFGDEFEDGYSIIERCTKCDDPERADNE